MQHRTFLNRVVRRISNRRYASVRKGEPTAPCLGKAPTMPSCPMAWLASSLTRVEGGCRPEDPRQFPQVRGSDRPTDNGIGGDDLLSEFYRRRIANGRYLATHRSAGHPLVLQGHFLPLFVMYAAFARPNHPWDSHNYPTYLTLCAGTGPAPVCLVSFRRGPSLHIMHFSCT